MSTWLISVEEARSMGFALFIQLGVMLRHFADFEASLRELRDSGTVSLSTGAASVEPITRLLSGD